jgi:nucleoside-diphosphate-sugar epimerase
MKVLVTGGSGFVGSRLIESLLESGHDVTIFDKNPSRFYPSLVCPGDVRNLAQLVAAVRGKDLIFHLAAEHRDDVSPVSLYNEVNVGGAENLTKALDATSCQRVIFTSSVAVYPLNAGTPNEDSPTCPFNPYGKSKLTAERVFKKWSESRLEVSVTVIRPCVVFGERNRGNVYNLLKQISRGRFMMVGNGHNRKSMAYIGNLVSFLQSRMTATPGWHLFNYTDKPDLSTNEIISIARTSFGRAGLASRIHIPYFAGLTAGVALDLLARITGRKYPISSIRIRKFCADTTVATDRVDQTGFKRPFTLSQGIERMIQSEFLSGKSDGALFDTAGG